MFKGVHMQSCSHTLKDGVKTSSQTRLGYDFAHVIRKVIE